MNINDFLPLDFTATLDTLAEWSGSEVLVYAVSQPPGEPLTATNVTVRGKLSSLAMTDNLIDGDSDSVAAFAVGDAPNTGFHLSKSHFVRTQPLPPSPGMGAGAIRMDFKHDYSIQVTRLA